MEWKQITSSSSCCTSCATGASIKTASCHIAASSKKESSFAAAATTGESLSSISSLEGAVLWHRHRTRQATVQ